MNNLSKAFIQVSQKEPEYFGQELNRYQVKEAYQYEKYFLLEVKFANNDEKQPIEIEYKNIKLPEGDFDPYGDYICLVNPDNSMTFLYRMHDGFSNIYKANLEPLINEKLEEMRNG